MQPTHAPTHTHQRTSPAQQRHTPMRHTHAPARQDRRTRATPSRRDDRESYHQSGGPSHSCYRFVAFVHIVHTPMTQIRVSRATRSCSTYTDPSRSVALLLAYVAFVREIRCKVNRLRCIKKSCGCSAVASYTLSHASLSINFTRLCPFDVTSIFCANSCGFLALSRASSAFVS